MWRSSLFVAISMVALAISSAESSRGILVYEDGQGITTTKAVLFDSFESFPAFYRLGVGGRQMEVFKSQARALAYLPPEQGAITAAKELEKLQAARKKFPALAKTFDPAIAGWQKYIADRKAALAATAPTPSFEKPPGVGAMDDGRTVSKVVPNAVTVATDTGLDRIPFDRLSESERKRFGLTAEAAASYSAQENRQQEIAAKAAGISALVEQAVVKAREISFPLGGIVQGSGSGKMDGPLFAGLSDDWALGPQDFIVRDGFQYILIRNGLAFRPVKPNQMIFTKEKFACVLTGNEKVLAAAAKGVPSVEVEYPANYTGYRPFREIPHDIGAHPQISIYEAYVLDDFIAKLRTEKSAIVTAFVQKMATDEKIKP